VFVLVLVASTMLLPFLNLLAVSFSGNTAILRGEVSFWPVGFQTATYRYVLNSPQLLQSLANTLFITVAGTLLSVLLTGTLAYGLSKKYIMIRRPALLLVVFTMLFNPGMIPNYLVVRGMGLINSRWALIVPVLVDAFNLLIMKTFFQQVPLELEESALIDGADPMRIFFYIVVPLTMHGIATICLFYAVARWNTFFSGVLYLNRMSQYPLQVILREILVAGTTLEGGAGFSQDALNIPTEGVKAATILFATAPILIVYPFLQKYFVKGALLGAIKG